MENELIDKFIFEKLYKKNKLELSILTLMYHILKDKNLDLKNKAKEITEEVLKKVKKDKSFDLLREKVSVEFKGQNLNEVVISDEYLLPEDLTESQKDIGDALSQVIFKFVTLATSLVEQLKQKKYG